MKICFASHNQHKLEEIQQLMPKGYEVMGLNDFRLTDEIDETGDTLTENAGIKAQYVFDKLNIPVFADDSGLEVAALGGEPGVYSARYAGPQKNSDHNMDLLLNKLEAMPDRSACFRTVVSFIDETGKHEQFEGRVDGEIIHERRGTGGFGYDPIFQPTGFKVTFAEMTAEQKNAISHRAKAVEKFIKYLSEQ